MVKRVFAWLMCVIIVTASGFVPAAADEQATTEVWKEFYVSAAGSDDADGSAQQPFRTVSRARDAVRSVSDDMQGDIVVNIASGEYCLDETLSFRAEDSGKNGHKIIYRGVGEERPKLSGGKRISGFELYDGSRNIYRAYAPELDVARELYVNGTRRFVAQTNQEISAVMKPEKNRQMSYYNKYPRAPKNDYSYYDPNTLYQYDGFYVSKNDIDMFKNQEDMELFWYHEYREAVFHVDKIFQDPDREENVIVTLKQNAYDLYMKDTGYFNLPPLDNFYIRNAYELLDTPGEFYFDRREKMLYYMPCDGEELAAAEVVVPYLERLVSLIGNTLDDRVRNITFENIEFTHATWKSAVDTDWLPWQATESYFYTNTSIESAVRVFIAEEINFYNNVFCRLGANAIDMKNIVKNCDIEGNCFYEVGAAAVQVGHVDHRHTHLYEMKDKYPDKGENGELLNLLNDNDSTVSGSFFGEYDGWSTTRSTSMYMIGALRNYRQTNYYNNFSQSFLTENDYSRFHGGWQSNPYAASRGEKSWIRYDMRESYNIDEITLLFDTDFIAPECRSNYEVLLSNDRFFEEGNYITVAQQTEPAGGVAKYRVDNGEKYRFLMIRTIGTGPLSLTYASATTKDRPTYRMYDRCDNISICNNYMERLSVDYPNSTGIFVMYGDNIAVKHNHIKEIPYSAISVGWSWGPGSDVEFEIVDGEKVFAKGYSYINIEQYNNGENIEVAYNRMEDISLHSNDGGAIYTLGGFQTGCTIHDNYVYNTGIGMRAYYLDNGTDRVHVYNNVAEDAAAFSSANYDGKSSAIKLSNNYSTNKATDSSGEPQHELQKVYTQGQYPEEVYNIIEASGLEKGYEYLKDIPCKGAFNLLDLDSAYNKAERIGFVSLMAADQIESADLILKEGKFGCKLGDYPYKTYHELSNARANINSVSSYNTSDVYLFREEVRKAGKSVNRLSEKQTLELCRQTAAEAQTFESNETPAENFYPAAALEKFNKSIEEYEALEQKNNYAAITLLENAYNEFRSSQISYDISYIYTDDMKYAEKDSEAKKITMYFDNLDKVGNKRVYVYPGYASEIADSFDNVSMRGGFKIPVYNAQSKKYAMWSVEIKQTPPSVSEDLNTGAFITVSDKQVAHNTEFGVHLSPDYNATVSRYYNPDSTAEFKITPVMLSKHYKFSILLGLDCEKPLYKRANTDKSEYFEAEFSDGYIYLYKVSGRTRNMIDRAKFAAENLKQYKLSYRLAKIGGDTSLTLTINDTVLFTDLYSGDTDGGAWGYSSSSDSIYVSMPEVIE